MSDSEEWDEAVEELEADLSAEPGATPAPTETESPPGSFYRSIGEYTSLAMIFPACMLLGFYGGRWLGGLLDGPGIGSAVGLLLGTAAAFLALYQSLHRLEHLGEAEDGDGASHRKNRGG